LVAKEKEGEDKIIENLDIEFKPEFDIKEAESDGKLKIGGVALVEGKSANGVKYSANNISENDGKSFKYVVGHPTVDVEDHVVGKGSFTVSEGKLMHEGEIINTSRHPDVVRKTQMGLLGPSIHARADKVIKEGDGSINTYGLNIKGMGLVTFQGVKDASIDFAIAESFRTDLLDVKESSVEDENNKDKESVKMSEEEVKQEAPEEKKEEVKQEEEKQENSEDSEVSEELKSVKDELKAMKDERRNSIIEQIVKLNKDMKSEDLVKEEESVLKKIYEYEKKISEMKPSEAGIVESEDAEKDEKEEVVESEQGVFLSESSWKKFNDEIKERIM